MGGDHALNDVDFVDATHGWAAGQRADAMAWGDPQWAYGAILRTRDGVRWEEAALAPGPALNAVSFPDASHGWAVGGQGRVVRTADGGDTWSDLPSAGPLSLRDVRFADAERGWAVGVTDTQRSRILRTTDGGATWQAAALPGTSYSYAEDIAFADEQHGRLAGDHIWKTADGGATWTIDGARVAPWFVDQTLSAIAAQPAGAVWAVGAGGRIISTVDTSADTAAPQTVDDGDRIWRRTGETVHLSATDAGGGSVTRTEYRVDGETARHEGAAIEFDAPADHYGDGAHTLRYRSGDDDGNAERMRICPVLIDTTEPWAGAGDDVRVRRGRTATLRYDLSDNLNPRLWVTVDVSSLASFWSGSKLVRTLLPGLQAQGRRAVKFRCTLRPGWYRWSVTATDLAGNTFVPWADGFLEVK